MPQGTIKLPEGFVLEEPKNFNLPPGFVLEDDQNAEPQTSIQTPPEQKSFSGGVMNAVNSTGRLLRDAGSAILHPIDTLTGMAQVASGAIGKVTPEGTFPGLKNNVQYADALGQVYKEKYGGWDNFLQTLYHDPAGVAADLSAVASLGGGMLRGGAIAANAANMSGTASTLSNAANVAKTASRIADPVQLSLRGAGTVARAGAKAIDKAVPAERIYESALKPSNAASNRNRIPGQVATGLRENIPVSSKGAKKIDSLINELSEITTELAKQSAEQGGKINAQKVASRLEGMKIENWNQVNAQPDIAAIREVGENFLNNPHVINNKGQIPANIALDMRRGTYARLQGKYEKLSEAHTQAEKALARGITEELKAIVPELKDIDLRNSDLISLQKQMDAAIPRIMNRDISRVGPIGVAAATYHFTHSGATAASAAALMHVILSQPEIKSKLAIAIYNARMKNPIKYPNTLPITAIARVEEYVSSLENYLNTEAGRENMDQYRK